MTCFDFQDPMKVHAVKTFLNSSFLSHHSLSPLSLKIRNVNMVFIELIDSISMDGPDTPCIDVYVMIPTTRLNSFWHSHLYFSLQFYALVYYTCHH